MPKSELVELFVEGLGPIGHADLEFDTGFNVLTGETGAGKTLLIGALSLCMGSHDNRGFGPGRTVRARTIVRHEGVDVAFARESGASGRLRASIDGAVTSAADLHERASTMIEVFGQHDSQRLRGRGESRRILDAFSGIDDVELRALRARLREIEVLRSEFGGDSTSRAREEEFVRYQLAEIARVAITDVSELDRTLERLEELTLLRDHQDELLAALEELDGEDAGALTLWSRAVARIPATGSVGDIRAQLSATAAEARELVRGLARLADEWQGDPAELSALEHRAGELRTVARKFGGTLADVLVEADKLTHRLEEFSRAGDTLGALDRERDDLTARESTLAAVLRGQRSDAARQLGTAVSAQLSRVALTNAQFAVQVGGDDGSHVDFLFAPSRDDAPGPLGELASGGELARVLLAISLVTVAEDVVAIFDEIDAGVGGTVAQQIGVCLHELSRRQQVIVVTHLASIAARADRHFVVTKVGVDGVSAVRVVEGDDRVSEIARMLAGESSRLESRALAQRLLTDAYP